MIALILVIKIRVVSKKKQLLFKPVIRKRRKTPSKRRTKKKSEEIGEKKERKLDEMTFRLDRLSSDLDDANKEAFSESIHEVSA